MIINVNLLENSGFCRFLILFGSIIAFKDNKHSIMRIYTSILMFGLVMTACVPSPKNTSMASPSLSAIDSLMWEQPDSALKVMMEFAESGRSDSLDEFDGHYCQLLISELLYKNHYAQTNREDLLKAVEFFDSIDDGFLAARAHYMNGVGYVEKDSVVEACTE